MTATCRHCGPVWMCESADFLACPWCVNRLMDKPTPRPSPVRCGDCAHFQREGFYPKLSVVPRGCVLSAGHLTASLASDSCLLSRAQ